MAKVHILFNAKSNNGKGPEDAKAAEAKYEGASFEYHDVLQIPDYDAFVASIPAEEIICLCGGDGTLNYYINHTTEETKDRSVDFFGTGTGNDFLRDLGKGSGDLETNVNRFMKGLPTVTIKGQDYKFINGVGYGIDGYCCEVGDELRATTDKPIDYTGIAIKGLLFHFKPVTATVTIDGETSVWEKCWLVPTMKGHYYGGGMMPCPAQDRSALDGKLSVMTYCTGSKLKALIVFPNIFKGEHIKKEKVVKVFTGKEITVKFDRPVAAQVDGETIKEVTEYTVRA